MLSAFPPFHSSDGLFGNPCPASEGGFVPWDYQEPFFLFPSQEPAFFPYKQQEPEPVISNSGSENLNPKPVTSNSGSDEPDRSGNHSSPNSDDPNRPTSSTVDEKKNKRKISNRESARRSRMRKQKHLENLRNEANQLKIENRELMNQLRLVTHHCQLVRTDNDRLQTESAMLREKLWATHQILLVREIQAQGSNNFMAKNQIDNL